MRIRVVLPAPFSPTTAWMAPFCTWRLTFWRASTGPKRLVMPCMSTAGGIFSVASGSRGRLRVSGNPSPPAPSPFFRDESFVLIEVVGPREKRRGGSYGSLFGVHLDEDVVEG